MSAAVVRCIGFAAVPLFVEDSYAASFPGGRIQRKQGCMDHFAPQQCLGEGGSDFRLKVFLWISQASGGGGGAKSAALGTHECF